MADSNAAPLIGRLTAIAQEARWACVRPEYHDIREELLNIAMDLERMIDALAQRKSKRDSRPTGVI